MVRLRPWAPIEISNIYINRYFTDILFSLLPNLLPKTWGDSGLFIQERFATVRLVRAVRLACLRIFSGGVLTAVVIVMVTAQIHYGEFTTVTFGGMAGLVYSRFMWCR